MGDGVTEREYWAEVERLLEECWEGDPPVFGWSVGEADAVAEEA